MSIHSSPAPAAQGKPYNEAATSADPERIIYPQTMAELAILFAQCSKQGQSISLHATGHDFEGRSCSGDVIAHLGAFNAVHYDPATGCVTVGGGTRVAELNDVLRPYGRAVSTGTNQDVGIVGLALGGGAAYTSRSHGLTCDAIVSVELCTFAGDVLHVDDASDPKLMRLLRGAGGGWFGAVTKMVLKTYPVTPITSFSARWDGATAPTVLAELEQHLVDAPDDLSMRVGANVAGYDKTLCVTLSGQYLGEDAKVISRYFGPIADVSTWQQQCQPYFDAMAGARHVTSGGCFRIKSRFATTHTNPTCLHEMFDHLAKWTPTDNSDGAGFGLFAWGGQVGRYPAARSCVAGRDAAYLASFDTSWMPDTPPEAVDTQLDWVGALDQIAAREMSDQSYINFPDSDDIGFHNRHLAPFSDALADLIAMHDPARIGRQVARVRLRRPSQQE